MSRVFVPPQPMRDALARIFDASRQAIDTVRIVEHSRFARLHGRGVVATTRTDAIHLAGPGRAFAADPELVLHEYFHVLRQWNAGTLTVFRYVVESLKYGYRNNRFECEARAFARQHMTDFTVLLGSNRDALGI